MYFKYFKYFKISECIVYCKKVEKVHVISIFFVLLLVYTSQKKINYHYVQCAWPIE